MSSTFPSRRSYEHPLVTLKRKAKGRLQDRGREFYYDRLMQVAIRHDYYNRSRNECPDFICQPTAASVALMADLGLLFQAEAAGFSVLYDLNREEDFLAYLLRQKESDPPPHQSWTRLTFTLALTNPYFVSFTDMPIDTNPSVRNFYVTNQEARGTAAEAIFSSRELLPVIAAQVPVTVTDEVKEVRVLSISGERVLCKPRCVTRDAAATKNPADFTCDDLGEWACMDEIYLDFAGLPEDKYTIQRIGYDGQVLEPPVYPAGPDIYTQACPIPLCLIDLLFAAPTAGSGGIYPVRDLAPGTARIVPVRYVLSFERRAIQWRYFIVPQPQTELTDLQIVSEPETGFYGPHPVVLANGARAYRFVSQGEIPLEAQSEYRFRLLGRHALTAHVRTLVDRLPVASSQQVLPSNRKREAQAYSDIFVYV